MKGNRMEVRCSFCGKPKDRVQKLIAGPGVFICDECVDLCNDILKEPPPARTSQVMPPAAEWVASTTPKKPWWRQLFRIEGAFEPV